jgi:hypothetical protein
MTDEELEEFIGDDTINVLQRLKPVTKSGPKPQR